MAKYGFPPVRLPRALTPRRAGKLIVEKQGAIIILCLLPWHFGIHLGIFSYSLVIPIFQCDYGLLMPLFYYFKGKNVLLLLGRIFSNPSTISVFKCMPVSIFLFPFKLQDSKSVFQNHFLFVLRLV